MDSVLEHVVDKIWVRLHKVIQVLQILKFLALFFIEDVEVDVTRV